jgi:hypothetical protein
MKQDGDDQLRLQRMFRRVTGRKPSEKDLPTLIAGLKQFRKRYRATPRDAELLLQQGAKAAPADLDKTELAAWMLIANTLLNLDETLVRN